MHNGVGYFGLLLVGLLLLVLAVTEGATHPVGFRIWNIWWDGFVGLLRRRTE